MLGIGVSGRRAAGGSMPWRRLAGAACGRRHERQQRLRGRGLGGGCGHRARNVVVIWMGLAAARPA